MFKFIQTGLFCGLLLAITGCTRSFEKTATVSLSIPPMNKMSAASTCAGTCLKSIVIKIEGSGFEKIVKKISASNIRDASEVAGDFSFDIPTGDNRTIKVAAIYVLNKKHILAYADTNVNLPDTTAKSVELAMVNKGQIHGGSLVGRYITGQTTSLPPLDEGPTGDVDMILNYNSDPDFDMYIGQGQILNGWFDFMASEDLKMTYKVSDTNEVIFDKQSLNTLVPLTVVAGTPRPTNIGRIVRPASYLRYNNSNWELEEEKHDIIYGFFSPAGTTFASSKYVCFEDASTAVPFNKLKSAADGVTLLTYSTADEGDVNTLGGLTSADTTNCPGYNTADRFAADKIYINKDQLDGNGNDTAKGFGNAFTYASITNNGIISIQKYATTMSGGTRYLTIKTLPGLFGANATDVFSGARIYRKANSSNTGQDEITCSNSWLTDNSFAEVTGSTATYTSQILNIQIPNPSTNVLPTDGLLVCPTKNNDLQTHGGFYLGGLMYSQLTSLQPNFYITTPTPGWAYVYITNTGNTVANIIDGTLTSAGTIAFFNGSFTAAGNCGIAIAPASTCQIKLTATSIGTTNLQINYDQGSLTIPINSGP